MLEFGARGNCEDCFDENRVALINLARRYVPVDHWLQNPEQRMPGDYSLLAIHAMARRVNIERSSLDVRGPFLREDPDILQDEDDLLFIKNSISSNKFAPDHINMLREIAQRGRQSYDRFLNKGKKHWDEQAKKAKPFLDQLSDQYFRDSQQKRESLQRAYWLEQGPFVLAKIALGRCSGPWFRQCPYGQKYRRFHVPAPRSDSY